MISPGSKTLLAVVFLSLCAAGTGAFAASCTTQSQMTAIQRDSLVSGAKEMLAQMQSGNVQALQANTLPAVAADFSGIAGSVQNLKPLIQNATLTVDNLFLLDASTQTANAPIEFFCGQPVVTVNFSDLPPGNYALAVARATGVSQPQQMA